MKEVAAYVVQSHGYSQRRACSLADQHRSTQRKASRRDPRLEVRQRMRDIAATRVRYCASRLEVVSIAILLMRDFHAHAHAVHRNRRLSGRTGFCPDDARTGGASPAPVLVAAEALAPGVRSASDPYRRETSRRWPVYPGSKPRLPGRRRDTTGRTRRSRTNAPGNTARPDAARCSIARTVMAGL